MFTNHPPNQGANTNSSYFEDSLHSHHPNPLVTKAFSAKAREILAEEVLAQIGLPNESLAQYLASFVDRALNVDALAVQNPFEPAEFTSNLIRLFELRALIGDSEDKQFTLFHLQFGEIVLAICSSPMDCTKRMLCPEGVEPIFNDVHRNYHLIERQYQSAARGREEDLKVDPGVLLVISARTPLICEATTKITSKYLGIDN